MRPQHQKELRLFARRPHPSTPVSYQLTSTTPYRGHSRGAPQRPFPQAKAVQALASPAGPRHRGHRGSDRDSAPVEEEASPQYPSTLAFSFFSSSNHASSHSPRASFSAEFTPSVVSRTALFTHNLGWRAQPGMRCRPFPSIATGRRTACCGSQTGRLHLLQCGHSTHTPRSFPLQAEGREKNTRVHRHCREIDWICSPVSILHRQTTV